MDLLRSHHISVEKYFFYVCQSVISLAFSFMNATTEMGTNCVCERLHGTKCQKMVLCLVVRYVQTTLVHPIC